MTSSGAILSFVRPEDGMDRDWTTKELAEFYRVVAALIRGGLRVDVDRGVSDEGDPWFVFCREDSGEVIAHVARIQDQYVIASTAVFRFACQGAVPESDKISLGPVRTASINVFDVGGAMTKMSGAVSTGLLTVVRQAVTTDQASRPTASGDHQ